MAITCGNLPGRKAVADKKVFHDPANFIAVHQEIAAPPAFKFQEAFRFLIHIGVKVEIFAEPGIGWRQGLKIRDQIGAVKTAIAHIGHQRRRPATAGQPAQIAHGVLALFARPIGKRGAIQHQSAKLIGQSSAQHHHRPAALAIADHNRFRRFGVGIRHMLQEHSLGRGDIQNGLAGFRVAEEDHEINGVPAAQRDTYLAV